MATHLADLRWQLALERLRALSQPSWTAMSGVAAAAALATWWIMARQAPMVDPQSVIEANLAAAHQAMRQDRLVEPIGRSALHHFTAVLALDPTHTEARAGLQQMSEHFAGRTKAAIVDGRFAEAVVALDTLRRLDPDFRRIPLLDAQLRRAIEERALLHASSIHAISDRRTEKAARLTPAATNESRPAPPSAKEQTLAQPPSSPPDEAPEDVELESGGWLAETPELGATFGSAQPTLIPTPPDTLVASHEGRPQATLAEPLHGTPDEAPPAMREPPRSVTLAPESEPAPGTIDSTTPPSDARALLSYVAPEYPREAVLRGIEGWIDVQLSVTPAGDVINPTVQAGKARQLFERNALAAVRRWKYESRPEGSAPEQMQVRVSFKLEE